MYVHLQCGSKIKQVGAERYQTQTSLSSTILKPRNKLSQVGKIESAGNRANSTQLELGLELSLSFNEVIQSELCLNVSIYDTLPCLHRVLK